MSINSTSFYPIPSLKDSPYGGVIQGRNTKVQLLSREEAYPEKKETFETIKGDMNGIKFEAKDAFGKVGAFKLFDKNGNLKTMIDTDTDGKVAHIIEKDDNGNFVTYDIADQREGHNFDKMA